MSYNHLLIEDAPHARIITLNRPERRNALCRVLMHELHDAVHRTTRTVILAAAGPAFSAGHDLRELNQAVEADDLFRECSELMLGFRRLPQAVIAEVQGMATAAGCQLVAACDLAVAAPEARFATPGVRIGLFCTTPAVPLVRCIGMRRAMEMLLTGSPISAATALEWGLINRIAPAERLRTETLTLAQTISEGSPAAVAHGKQAVYEAAGLPEADAYERSSCVMVENLAHPDAHEGISAFLEKRRPVWPSLHDD